MNVTIQGCLQKVILIIDGKHKTTVNSFKTDVSDGTRIKKPQSDELWLKSVMSQMQLLFIQFRKQEFFIVAKLTATREIKIDIKYWKS